MYSIHNSIISVSLSSISLAFFLNNFGYLDVCRRNLPGDRQRALDIMLPLVEDEENVASDIYCLVGRIYKDTFLESHFTDTQSRDSGTLWWVWVSDLLMTMKNYWIYLFIFYFINTVSNTESSSMELLTIESLMWEEATAIIKKVRIS